MKSFFKDNGVFIIIIIGVILLNYSGITKLKYFGDDKIYIEKKSKRIKEIIKTGKAFRPITFALYSIEKKIKKEKPLHFINLIMFMALSLLVYYTLSNLLLLKKINSLILTLIFASYPIHNEVICNIKSIDEILTLTFFIISIVLLIKGQKILSVIVYFFALLSKETAVSFVVIYPMIIYANKQESIIKSIKKTWQYIVPVIIYLLLRFIYLKDIVSIGLTKQDNALMIFNNPERFFNKFYLLLIYMKKLLIPYPLSWDYSLGYYKFNKITFITGIVTFSLIITGLTILVYKLIKNKNIDRIYVGALLVLVSILPASNIIMEIPVTFADRFLFTASFGVIIILSSEKIINRKIVKIILISILPVFLLVNINNVPSWKDDKTKNLYDYNHGNRSFRVECNVLNNLNNKKDITSILKNLSNNYTDIEHVNGIIAHYYLSNNEYEKSLKYYNNAIKLNPNENKYYINEGVIYQKTKNFRKAINLYKKAIFINSNNPIPYENMGMVYHEMGKLNLAEKYYNKAIQKGSNNPIVINNLRIIQKNEKSQ